MHIRRTIFLLPFVSACLFHHADEPQAPLRSAARDSLLTADAARSEPATRQGLASAAATWLDSGVVYLRTGAPILYGRAAALTILGEAAPDRSTYQWRPLGGGVSRDGQGGYTFGIATTARLTRKARRPFASIPTLPSGVAGRIKSGRSSRTGTSGGQRPGQPG